MAEPQGNMLEHGFPHPRSRTARAMAAMRFLTTAFTALSAGDQAGQAFAQTTSVQSPPSPSPRRGRPRPTTLPAAQPPLALRSEPGRAGTALVGLTAEKRRDVQQVVFLLRRWQPFLGTWRAQPAFLVAARRPLTRKLGLRFGFLRPGTPSGTHHRCEQARDFRPAALRFAVDLFDIVPAWRHL